MADWYSDHYNSTVAQSAIQDPRPAIAAGLNHGEYHYKRATVTPGAGVTDDEKLFFFTLKSSDRLQHLWLSTAAGLTGTTMTSDMGVYRGEGGALYDLDLFCAAGTSPCDDLTVAIARVDLFILGALEVEDRGKQMWELVEEGATQSWTEDPGEVFDIILTMNTETSVTAATELILEAQYVSA